MIKLRVQGTIEEVERFISELKARAIAVKNVSGFYRNRGERDDGRVYLEVLNSVETDESLSSNIKFF